MRSNISNRVVKGECTLKGMELAKKRIMPHVNNLNMVNYDVFQLACNCYLQGVEDTTLLFIQKHGVIFDSEHKVMDYQI